MSEALNLGGIEARADAATEGPWEFDETLGISCELFRSLGAHEWGIHLGSIEQRDDAEFIARARDDVPALLAEVRRLRGVIERLHIPDPEYLPGQMCAECGHDRDGEPTPWPCRTMRALWADQL